MVLDSSKYILQTCIYLRYKDEIFYLKKNKPQESTHGTLIGWGGNFEEDEDEYQCAIRELEEELSLHLKKEDLVMRGILLRHDLQRKIYILEYVMNNKLPSKEVENEGLGYYKPLNHYKTNPEEFLKHDLIFLDVLFNSDKNFIVSVYSDESTDISIFDSIY